MRRREFITRRGGTAVAWPLAVVAQPKDRVRRIGVLTWAAENDPDSRTESVAPFQQGLEKLGWKLGRNLYIDYRWGIVDVERARAAAAELLRLAPDAILAIGTPATRALQHANSTVPIVFAVVSEPVTQGFVQSLAHPGGNMTGFTNLEPSVGAKWLELLKEIAPNVTRVAVIINPQVFPFSVRFSRSAEAVAAKFAVEAVTAPVHDTAEFEPIMKTLGRQPGGGLIFPVDPFTSLHRKLIIGLADRYELPAIYGFRHFAAEGGLISYGADQPDLHRQAATYVDRILRGEKPADLPVQQPTKFELVVNVKTAKTLGLTVPPSLLTRADEVIE